MFSLGCVGYGAYGYLSLDGDIYYSEEYTDIYPLRLDAQNYGIPLGELANSLVRSADWEDEDLLEEAVRKLVSELLSGSLKSL